MRDENKLPELVECFIDQKSESEGCAVSYSGNWTDILTEPLDMDHTYTKTSTVNKQILASLERIMVLIDPRTAWLDADEILLEIEEIKKQYQDE